MRRALIKAAGLNLFGALPGGVKAYRFLTREVMGTQASHITKLHRIWPEVIQDYISYLGKPLEGGKIWVNDPGWTPFPGLLNYLTTGQGGVLLNTTESGARILDRHVTESINMALDLVKRLKDITAIPKQRVRELESLRWRDSLGELLKATDSTYHYGADPAVLPIESDSVDFLYSGGQLEHYRPGPLKNLIREMSRVMKPGGLAVIVLDHRDHLFHFDKKLPFLYHYGLSDRAYNLTHNSPLLFHNRHLPGQFCALLEEAGFTRVKLFRRPLPLYRWVEDGKELEGDLGIAREKLNSRFRESSDDDLKTAAAKYVYVKPK